MGRSRTDVSFQVDPKLGPARSRLSVAAKIVTAVGGGSIRTITGRGYTKPVGRYPSKKAGRSMPWEASHERDLILISEADVEVVDYLSQPHRLEMHVKGRSQVLRYFPDLLRKMQDGSVEVIETKKTADEVDRDPDYKLKMVLAKEAYRRLGYSFRVVIQEEIRSGLSLTNAKVIQSHRHARIVTADRLRFRECFADSATRTYGEVISKLSTAGSEVDPVARAKLHALVVRRVANMDIRKRLDLSAPVTLVADAPAFLPRGSHGQR